MIFLSVASVFRCSLKFEYLYDQKDRHYADSAGFVPESVQLSIPQI